MSENYSVNNFFADLRSLMHEADRQIHSDNLSILELISRRLGDSLHVLGILYDFSRQYDAYSAIGITLSLIIDKVRNKSDLYDDLCSELGEWHSEIQ